MSQAMLLKDDERDVLGDLQIGQAVVRLQGRGARPFLTSVPEFKIEKGSFTDAKVIRHMTKLGLLSVRNQPKMELLNYDNSSALTISPTEVFLTDVAEFHDSGVAERYKRLGLSVRQGQKIKAELVEKGMVQEQVQTTGKGKLRIIRLTEQVKLTLLESGYSFSQPA